MTIFVTVEKTRNIFGRRVRRIEYRVTIHKCCLYRVFDCRAFTNCASWTLLMVASHVQYKWKMTSRVYCSDSCDFCPSQRLSVDDRASLCMKDNRSMMAHCVFNILCESDSERHRNSAECIEHKVGESSSTSEESRNDGNRRDQTRPSEQPANDQTIRNVSVYVLEA